jgi:hypothetical protein
MEGWNTTWLGIPNITPSLKTFKLPKFILPQSRLILVEEIF